MSIGSFCVLLALAMIRSCRKRNGLKQDNNQIALEEKSIRVLEVEAELMWHVIPKNMLNGEHSFFLSLFSTSCSLVNAIMNAVKYDKTYEKLGSNEVHIPSEVNNETPKECLPVTSDSETGSSLGDRKSSNILISCVGRRSKRRKKKKVLEKRQDEKANKETNHINEVNETMEALGKTTSISASLDLTTDAVRLTSTRVLIPNEQNGSITATCVPVIGQSHHVGTGTLVRDVMAIISFKQKVVNPYEFGLYLLSFEPKEEHFETKERLLESSDAANLISITKNIEDIYHGNLS